MIVTHAPLYLLLFVSVVSASELYIPENKYELLPPIFHIDSYDKCLEERKQFCKITIHIAPLNESSEIWKIIEETKASNNYYNHDELYHAICLQDHCYDCFSLEIATQLSKIYSKKYQNIGLRANVTKLNCKFQGSPKHSIRTFDTLFMAFIILYSTLIARSTIYDIKERKYWEGKAAFSLSLLHNARRMWQNYEKTKLEELKCIQGVRAYTTIMIIFCHTFCSFAGGYIHDTKYLEDIPHNIFRRTIRSLFVFLVQTFFLLSGWLLSYNSFRVFSGKKKLNYIRYILLTFINRYLRIIFPVLLMIGLGSTPWIYGNFQGPIKDIYSDAEFFRCQNNWWTNLLFINNHCNQHDMCYFITWYLAADTQLYLMSLFLLVLLNVFENNIKTILKISILAGILIPSLIAYYFDLDVIFRITPENSKNNSFMSFDFNTMYTSTPSNMATFTLGLAFGYFYYKQSNCSFFTRLQHRLTIWWICVIGLPFLCLIASSFQYNRLTSAILFGALRPIYALGIGIGILGMSKGAGGILKSICEWKPALFLGNITYCTYVVQFGIIFNRTALATSPMNISDFILFKSFAHDVALSFLGGFLMHLTVELPAQQLQKILIPKFKTTNKIHKS